MTRSRFRGLVATAAMLASSAALFASPAAAAEWPRRLFKLYRIPSTETAPQGAFVRDVAETTDGTVVLGTGLGLGPPGGSLLTVMPDGRARTLALFTGTLERASGPSIGIAPDADGGTLVVQGWTNQVVRVRTSGRSTVLAGTGHAGFSGDGGPATAAEISPGGREPSGVARTADGSIVFTDARNLRVRRVRPDGVIETIAGAGPGYLPSDPECAPPGDGGPATRARLCHPSDLIAAADGSVVIAEFTRIRRIATDGTITTIAGTGVYGQPRSSDAGKRATRVRVAPIGLTRLANGDILYSSLFGISRLTRDGRYQPFLDFRPEPHGMTDFAGRSMFNSPAGLAETGEGGVLMAVGRRAYYLAPRRSQRTLVGIRNARVRRGEVTIDIQASRASRATVSVRLRGRSVARIRREVGGGQQLLRVPGNFASRPHHIRVTLQGPGDARAHDALPLYLGGSLAKRYVTRLAGRQIESDGEKLRGCRRFGARRIDCAYGPNRGCDRVLAFTLRHTGVIWTREYDCTDVRDAFRRQPAWEKPARALGAPDI